jgi:glutamate-ammonia-ligase adenylyltransferase
MLLIEDESKHPAAERLAEAWIRESRRVAMASGYYPIDIRLRPEGGKGLIVRTLQGLQNYAATTMETWERLAFTKARSLRRNRATDVAIAGVMSNRVWGWHEETEILKMRARIHSERLHPWELTRDLKLGEGFLMDVEWLCSVLRLRHPELVSESRHTVEFVHRMAELGLIGAIEASEINRAVLRFSRMRDVLYLLDYESDSLIPENPQKLERLALVLGAKSGNALLAELEELRHL